MSIDTLKNEDLLDELHSKPRAMPGQCYPTMHTYLRELVRYIHLNPLRVGIVSDLSSLKSYKYGGMLC